MIRYGLCCIFKQEPIKFQHTNAKILSKYDRKGQLEKLSAICLNNSMMLLKALEAVKRLNIKAFRILSPFFPLYTHPDVGFYKDELPDYNQILANLEKVKQYRKDHDIRLSFHPDQFIVINSPKMEVVKNSIEELKYQAMLSELVGADVINIHVGGVYGDKSTAVNRFIENVNMLPENVRKRLSIENDDKSYHVEDLKPISDETGLPIVYDVHHHRCNPDKYSVEDATDISIKSWQKIHKEPYFHISSPKYGWDAAKTMLHADYINPKDFPEYWNALKINFTVDIEAKAKELAVVQLFNHE